MDEMESRETTPEGERERILTININLEGPAELLSWAREHSPTNLGARLAGLLPADFTRHARAARREQLLAVRSLLDCAIQRLEKDEKPPRRAEDVEVE